MGWVVLLRGDDGESGLHGMIDGNGKRICLGSRLDFCILHLERCCILSVWHSWHFAFSDGTFDLCQNEYQKDICWIRWSFRIHVHHLSFYQGRQRRRYKPPKFTRPASSSTGCIGYHVSDKPLLFIKRSKSSASCPCSNRKASTSSLTDRSHLRQTAPVTPRIPMSRILLLLIELLLLQPGLVITRLEAVLPRLGIDLLVRKEWEFSAGSHV